jgi:hypothetical protein
LIRLRLKLASLIETGSHGTYTHCDLAGRSRVRREAGINRRDLKDLGELQAIPLVLDTVRVHLLAKLAIEEEEGFPILHDPEDTMARAGTGISFENAHLLDRRDVVIVVGVDTAQVTAEVGDDNVLLLGVDDDVVKITPVLAGRNWARLADVWEDLLERFGPWEGTVLTKGIYSRRTSVTTAILALIGTTNQRSRSVYLL